MNTTEFKQQKLQGFEIRKSQYNNTWKTDLTGAICANPLCEYSSWNSALSNQKMLQINRTRLHLNSASLLVACYLFPAHNMLYSLAGCCFATFW
jgi:hypothetical protein